MGEKLDAPVSAPIPWLRTRKMLGFALFQLFRGDLFEGAPSLCYLFRQEKILVRYSLLMLILMTCLCLPAPGSTPANEVSAGMLACVGFTGPIKQG